MIPDISEVKIPQNPEQIVRNTKVLQRLALQQVMAITIITNLDYIINEPPHCKDRVLQKSMIGNLS